jgi:spermidine synthase
MRSQLAIDRVHTPDDTELVLVERDGVYTIRVDGYELMSSRSHGSEEALAALGCAALGDVASPHVLIGGLGMGFTLRAALDRLPEKATVTVAEVFAAVISWNCGPLAELAGAPLFDARVSIAQSDVAALLGRPSQYDAVLLDVDNGPEALTLERNNRLYSASGVARTVRSLRPGGVLAVWSADPDPRFARRLERAGLGVRIESVPTPGASSEVTHTIFIGRRTRRAHRPHQHPQRPR